MKKLLTLLIAGAMSVSAMSITAMADDKITLVVNGEKVDFSGDQEPVIQNGRTLVPFRAAFEKMGAEVKWFEDIKLCEAEYGGITVGIAIGDTMVSVGEAAQIESDVPAQIINGRTMVPLRILSESIGAEVNWDSATKTVTVNTPDVEGDAPERVSCDTKSDVAEGKVKVTYQYPVVTEEYTGASVLNKNIALDIADAAKEIADTAETEKTQLDITYEITYNECGLLTIMYLIDGEMVYEGHYGISNGAKISDDDYAMIMGVGETDEEVDDGAAEVDDSEVAEENDACTIESYETSMSASDGSNFIYANVNYPKFTIDGDFVPSLNTQLYNSAKKAADSFVESYSDDALEVYTNPPEHLFEVPYSFTGDCEVEITDDNVAVINMTYNESKYGEDLITTTETIKINLDNGEVIE